MSARNLGGLLPPRRRTPQGALGDACLRRGPLGLVLALVAGALTPTLGRAAVTTGGDVALGQNVGSPSYVGKTGLGSIEVNAGSMLTIPSSLLMGTSSTGVGIVTVSGIGSQVQSGSAVIGDAGLGLAAIREGGRLLTSSARLGGSLGGYGEVVVDGPGSLWLNTSSTTLGGQGHSKVVVVNGGHVQSTGILAGDGNQSNAPSAAILVSGPGSVWFNQGPLSFNAYGTSDMQILAGGAVLNTGFQGPFALSSRYDAAKATLKVAGTGSLLSHIGEVQVGTFGRGTSEVRIESAGTMTAAALTIGATSVASGVQTTALVSVKGLGSTLYASNALALRGPGQLLISDGAQVSAASLNLIAMSVSESAPSLSINGQGSMLSVNSAMLGSSTLGGNPAYIDLSSGGTLQLNNNYSTVNAGAVVRLQGGRINEANGPRGGMGTLNNVGVIRGAGTIDAAVNNVQTGLISAAANAEIFVGGSFSNSATVEVQPRGRVAVVDKIGLTSSTSLVKVVAQNPGSAPQKAALAADGAISLAGRLDFSFNDGFQPRLGYSFPLAASTTGIAGMFAETLLPELATELAWLVDYQSTTVDLRVVPRLPADFNLDGTVSAADLPMWQTGYGAHGGSLHDGDVTGDGHVAGEDFLSWQRDLANSAQTAAAAPVPEPTAIASALAGWAIIGTTHLLRRRRAPIGSRCSY